MVVRFNENQKLIYYFITLNKKNIIYYQQLSAGNSPKIISCACTKFCCSKNYIFLK